MALRIKVVGSGSAQPKLLTSVNNPADETPYGWKAATDWVAPSTPNEETGEGGVNFASVAAGYPVWDGSRLHTEQGTMSLSRFYELFNVPESDRSYFEAQLDAAYDAAMNAPDADAAYVNCQPRWHPRCICVKRGTRTAGIKDGKLHLRVKPTFYGVAIIIPAQPPTIEATINYDFSEVDYHNRFVVFWERPTTVGTLDDGESAAEEVLSYEEGTPWPGDGGRRGLVKISYKNPYDGDGSAVADPFEGWVLPATNGTREDGRAFYGQPAKTYDNPESAALHKIVDDFSATPANIFADEDLGALILPDFFLTQISPGSSSLPAWRLGKYSVNGKLTYVSLGYATAPGMTNHSEKTFTNGNGSFTAIKAYYSDQRLLAALKLQNPERDLSVWPSLGGDVDDTHYNAGYAYYKDADGQQKIAYYDNTYDTGKGRAWLPLGCYAYVRENTNGPVWEEIEIKITSGRGAGGGATPSEGYETAYVDIPGDWSADGEISGNLNGSEFENPDWVQSDHKTTSQGADYTQLKITPPFVKQDGGWAPNQTCSFKIRRPRYASFGVIDSVYASFWLSAGGNIFANTGSPPSPGSFTFEQFPVG